MGWHRCGVRGAMMFFALAFVVVVVIMILGTDYEGTSPE